MATGNKFLCTSMPFNSALVPDAQWQLLPRDSTPFLVSQVKANPSGILQAYRSGRLTSEMLATLLSILLSDATVTDDQLRDLRIIPLASDELAQVPLTGESSLYCVDDKHMPTVKAIAASRLVHLDFIKHLEAERLLPGQGSMKRLALSRITREALEQLLASTFPTAQKVSAASLVVQDDWFDSFCSNCGSHYSVSPSAANLREVSLIPAQRASDGLKFVVSRSACATLPVINSQVPEEMRAAILCFPTSWSYQLTDHTTFCKNFRFSSWFRPSRV